MRKELIAKSSGVKFKLDTEALRPALPSRAPAILLLPRLKVVNTTSCKQSSFTFKQNKDENKLHKKFL